MRLSNLVFVSLLVGPSFAHAVNPPPNVTLDLRVSRASHVFVGIAKQARVVDVRRGERIIPEPKVLELGQAMELKVQVKDVMKPNRWRPKGILNFRRMIKVRYGGGYFSVKEIRERLLKKPLIYLTIKESSYFQPSYPWNLTVDLENRSRVLNLINEQSESK